MNEEKEERWRQVLTSLVICLFARGMYAPDDEEFKRQSIQAYVGLRSGDHNVVR